MTALELEAILAYWDLPARRRLLLPARDAATDVLLLLAHLASRDLVATR